MFSNVTRFFNEFTSDPVNALISLAYLAVCIVFSLVIHECAHGYVALKCGDPTAKMMGRLTLNPLKHLDPFGTICMIFLRVGWARPVPINPRNFRNYRRDYILVSLAGIAVNLAVFLLSLLISALVAKVMYTPDFVDYVASQGGKGMLLNIYRSNVAASAYSGIGLFSTGMKAPALLYVERLFLMLAQMNLGLAVFNLIPVPPLDGYRFVDQFVFKGRLSLNPQTMQMIHIVFLVVCISGALSGLLGTVNGAIFGLFSNMMGAVI